MQITLESLSNFSYLGESFALGSALVWAVAIILFRISGKTVHPLGLNFFKSLLSIFLLIGTMLALGESIFPKVQWKTYGLLLFSGAIGIGAADTLLFASLNRLGAGLSAIVACSYSPFVIFLSAAFIGERMIGVQLFGVALIILAVLMISQKWVKTDIRRKDLIAGIFLGLTAMFLTAVGIVIMKPILNTSSILWTLLIRTVGGILLLSLVLLFHPKSQSIWTSIMSVKNWGVMLPGSLLGGYLAFIAWTGGMKYIQASEASALNQMSTIFIFILGIIFLRESVTKERIIALLMAVTGVLFVILL